MKIIPVACIFQCKDYKGQIRLIVITGQNHYQESEKTKMLFDFIKVGQSSLHLMYFCYGTMLDYLIKGHLFFSENCNSTNCIFRSKGLFMLPENSHLLNQLKENALKIYNVEIEKVSTFLYGAVLYFKENMLNVATFMLHQTCEQL